MNCLDEVSCNGMARVKNRIDSMSKPIWFYSQLDSFVTLDPVLGDSYFTPVMDLELDDLRRTIFLGPRPKVL